MHLPSSMVPFLSPFPCITQATMNLVCILPIHFNVLLSVLIGMPVQCGICCMCARVLLSCKIIVLENRSLRLGWQHGQVRASFQVTDFPYLHMVEGARDSLGPLL